MKQKDLLAQLEHTNDRLWSYDPDLNCTYVNSNMSDDYLKAFGHRLTPGMSVLHNVPEPLFSIWNQRYRRALKGEKYTIVDNFDIEGVPEFVEVSFNPVIEDDQVISVACSSKDISLAKRAELQLKQSEANLNAQIENTSESIWSVNDRYEMVTMNSTFQREFNEAFNCNLKIGDPVIRFLPEPLESIWKERYDRALSGEQFKIVDTFEFSDAKRFVEISYNPVQIEGKNVGVACFTRDITDLKTSELELKEAVDTRDKFFSIIAHDLRGPVANIHQLAQILKLSGGNLDLHKQTVEMLANSSGSVYTLLDNLLNWALSQQGIIELKRQSLNLKSLIEEGIAPYKLNASLKDLSVEVPVDNDIIVVADRPTVSTIISNLFNNATKYTPEEGLIEISAKKNGKNVFISIKDSGVGMPKEKVEAILKENTVESTPGTKEEKGTGLGLTLCKEFVRLNGGKFTVESTEGKGSAFGFSLPLSK